MYNLFKIRLIKIVENRNYFFKDSTEEDANIYLQKKTDFTGIGEEEITFIENRLAYRFPEDFRNYLREFGANCGDLFCCGQDIETDQLIAYQTMGQDLIEENMQRNGVKNFLNANTVIFEFHQGYSFNFFKTNADKSINIYRYTEGDVEPTQIYVSFLDRFKAEIDYMEECNKVDTIGYFLTITTRGTIVESPALSSGIIPRQIGDRFINSNQKQEEKKIKKTIFDLVRDMFKK
jgi:hypothetical protein